MNNNFTVNCRALNKPITGIPRYLHEIISRFPDSSFRPLSPSRSFSEGIKGHLWEQLILPNSKNKEELLWSPSNTGPAFLQNQVVTIHDMAFFDRHETMSRSFQLFYSMLIPKLVKNCKRVIAVSEFTKSRISYYTNISPEKIITIHNGVSEDFFIAPKISKTELFKKLGINRSNYFLSLSSLEPRKNLDKLISAWKKLPINTTKDTNLVIAGGIGSCSVFQKQTLEGGNGIIFTGRLGEEELIACLHYANLFVYPSTYEGFGLPILEAMAAGTPVLCGNAKALKEVGGDLPIYINPHDSDLFAETLEHALKSPEKQKEKSDEAQKRAMKFNWQNTAEETFKTLLECSKS